MNEIVWTKGGSRTFEQSRFCAGVMHMPKPGGFGPMPMFPSEENMDRARFLVIETVDSPIDRALNFPLVLFSMN